MKYTLYYNHNITSVDDENALLILFSCHVSNNIIIFLTISNNIMKCNITAFSGIFFNLKRKQKQILLM